MDALSPNAKLISVWDKAKSVCNFLPIYGDKLTVITISWKLLAFGNKLIWYAYNGSTEYVIV